MGVQTALDAVRDAPGIVEAIRLADDLAFEAGRDPGVRTLRVLATALNGDDQVAAIAAVHALAEIFDEQAARMLTRSALGRSRRRSASTPPGRSARGSRGSTRWAA